MMPPDPDMVHIIPPLVVGDILVVVPPVTVFIFGGDILVSSGGVWIHNEVRFTTCEQEGDGGNGAKKRFVFHDESLYTRIRLY